jgi:hypothetical protein
MNVRKLYEVFEKTIKLDRKEFTRQVHAIGVCYPPETQAWIDRCSHRPSWIECDLASLDELCGTYGVEYIEADYAKPGKRVRYLNTGDPYTPTLLFCLAWKNPYRIATGGYASVVK